MTDERMAEILAYQKEHIDVNWDDDDKLITRKIKRSMKYFEEKTGGTLDFEDESSELELVFERVRYDWNHALDDFENNFGSEILSLIMDKALEAKPDGTDSGNIQ
jgi:hypothetical protein